MKEFDKFIVKDSSNIRCAIKQMDIGGMGFIIIVDKDEMVIGVVTDGDFRRAILSGVHLKKNILLITNKNYKYLMKGYSQNKVLGYFKGNIVEFLPVLENGKLVEIISKDDLYVKNNLELPEKKKLNLPVVIMAGGKGARLDPFTRILPKALIPIREKSIIEIIMDEYAQYGVKRFYISIRHKGRMIKAYFEDHKSKYQIEYIHESKPLGTAGALRHLIGKINKSFFTTNCDVIIKVDYSKIVKFHKEGKFDLTLVGSIHHQTIPYGVCTFKNGGLLESISEKPVYDFLVNTGMYLLNPTLLSYIPKNKYFDMTDLIDLIQKNGLRIGIFPVSEKSWIDVGQWKKYNETIRNLIQ